METILEGNAQVEVVDMGKNNTLQMLKVNARFFMPKDEGAVERYLDEAKEILDEMSKDSDPIGMNMTLGALIHLHLVEGYSGKDNQYD